MMLWERGYDPTPGIDFLREGGEAGMTGANRTPNVSAADAAGTGRNSSPARGRSLGTQPSEESREANHRAISTAYYAAYDALCASNATVSGAGRDRPGRRRCLGTGVSGFFPWARRRKLATPPGIAVAGRAVFRQNPGVPTMRGSEQDYSPRSVFNWRDAEHRLDQAEAAIEKLLQLPQPERVAIATITLLRDR